MFLNFIKQPIVEWSGEGGFNSAPVGCDCQPISTLEAFGYFYVHGWKDEISRSLATSMSLCENHDYIWPKSS